MWILLLILGCAAADAPPAAVEAPAPPRLDLGAASLPLAITPAGTVSATEVTNAAFRAFDSKHSSNRYQRRELYAGVDFDGDQHPVIATRLEALAFCAWASERTGKRVRLPTEAEWERFAAAGSSGRWSWGDDPTQAHRHANGNDPATFERLVQGDHASPQDDRILESDGALATAPVGSYLPNAWGLYDVHGNVTEWTSTPRFEDGVVRPAADDDPGQEWVLKGGAWNNGPDMMKTATTNWCNANNHYDAIGFRVVVEER